MEQASLSCRGSFIKKEQKVGNGKKNGKGGNRGTGDDMKEASAVERGNKLLAIKLKVSCLLE